MSVAGRVVVAEWRVTAKCLQIPVRVGHKYYIRGMGFVTTAAARDGERHGTVLQANSIKFLLPSWEVEHGREMATKKRTSKLTECLGSK